jgi:hypothetical protein
MDKRARIGVARGEAVVGRILAARELRQLES